MRPSRHEFQEMMRHLEKYPLTGQGAQQDFLTDFWRNKGGIATLPRQYNCHVLELRDQSTIRVLVDRAGRAAWWTSEYTSNGLLRTCGRRWRSKVELYPATWAAFQVLEKAIAEEIPADRPKRKPGQEGKPRRCVLSKAEQIRRLQYQLAYNRQKEKGCRG